MLPLWLKFHRLLSFIPLLLLPPPENLSLTTPPGGSGDEMGLLLAFSFEKRLNDLVTETKPMYHPTDGSSSFATMCVDRPGLSSLFGRNHKSCSHYLAYLISLLKAGDCCLVSEPLIMYHSARVKHFDCPCEGSCCVERYDNCLANALDQKLVRSL